MKLTHDNFSGGRGDCARFNGYCRCDVTKPAWLSDCSVGIKESYDNNVFLSGVQFTAALQCARWQRRGVEGFLFVDHHGFAQARRQFCAVAGATNRPTALSLAYSPDFVIYHNQGSESYNAHRVLATVKGGDDSATVNADNNFTYIDGSRHGPFYPGNLYSGFGTIFDRARRRQIMETANSAYS